MDGWEGEVLTIVKDLQEEGEAAVSAGRTDGHLRVVQAILAAEKLCADTLYTITQVNLQGIGFEPLGLGPSSSVENRNSLACLPG